MGHLCFKRKQLIKNKALRIFLAEFLGTFILLTIGNSSVAQAIFYPTGDSMILLNWGYSLAVCFAIYVSFNASGGHVNPAITTGFAVMGWVKWRCVPLYYIAQLLGAFASSPLVYGLNYEALLIFDGGNRTVAGPTGTGHLFALYPDENISTWTAFGQSITATAIFLICVAAVVDRMNSSPHEGMIPLLVALIVFSLGCAFGATSINPARDLGPRIFKAFGGWGMEAFRFRNYNWFWVPTAGPIVGSIIGAAIYRLMVELHWPQENTGGGDSAGEKNTGKQNNAYVADEDEANANTFISMTNKSNQTATLYS